MLADSDALQDDGDSVPFGMPPLAMTMTANAYGRFMMAVIAEKELGR